MSGTTDIYVTPSTSLVLLKSLSSVTNVYLGSFSKLFSVTIRDVTGLSSIATTPVRISTIGTAKFADGTSYYPLDKPYGLVNVSLRTSNTWQINHTSGKAPAQAAATIGVLSTNSSFFTLLSTAQKIVSTFVVENLTTPNSISITSPFIISNLSTPGFVLIGDTLFVRDNVQLSNSVYVSGPTTIISSLFAHDFQPFTGDVIQVLSSVGVGGNVTVESMTIRSTLTTYLAVQASSLQVTLSTPQDTAVVANSVKVAGLVSTLANFINGTSLTVGNNTVLTQEVSTFGGRFSTQNLSVRENTTLLSTLSTISPLGQTSFVSSFQTLSTVFVRQSASFESTVGIAGAVFTSSFSSFIFSTLGSVSTLQMRLLSTASITGNLSSAVLQSYQYISIGGNVFTTASISSFSNTQIQGDTSGLGNAVLATGHTSSSVGVGNDASVAQSTFLSYGTVESDFQSKVLSVLGGTTVEGDVGIGGDGFVYGNLISYGQQTISSFLVNSFLLSNVDLVLSSPNVSFRVSSLHASSIETLFTRISAPLPDIFMVSTTFASTTQLTNAIAENIRVDTLYTNSFFVGNTSDLASDSKPQFAINKKTIFAEGLSTLEIQANTIQAGGIVQGSFVGNVFYLSNVPAPFATFSTNTTSLSSLSLVNAFTSSFTASTFIVNKQANVFSTVVTPFLAFESQGYPLRYDTNQILTINSTTMTVNRSLTFNTATNKIGLFVSSPQYDFDISGQVYATNIYYSSINLIQVSTPSTVVYSTIYMSSTTIRDKLSYGSDGLRIYTTNPYFGDTSFVLNTTISSVQGSFGLYDCVEQSSIVVNTALQIYRNQRVAVNGADTATEEFVLPAHALDVTDTIRSQAVAFSTVNLLQSMQTTSYLTPNCVFNTITSNPLNSMSTSFEKLTLDTVMTLKANYLQSNRFVGIRTLYPQASLDVRGDAYFSTLYAFENCRANYVATSFQEF